MGDYERHSVAAMYKEIISEDFPDVVFDGHDSDSD